MKNHKYMLTIAVVGVISAAFATGLPTTGLQAHFRADHVGRVLTSGNVVPAHGDNVYSWATEPGVGSPLTLVAITNNPLWQANAFRRADGTYRPAIRFIRDIDNSADRKDLNGNAMSRMILASTETTTLNLGTQTTWFLVMNYLANQNGCRVFGFGADSPRFGAFVLGGTPDNRLRLHNNNDPAAKSVLTMSPGAYLVDSREDGSRMTCASNGFEAVNFDKTSAARSTPDTFYLGRMISENNTARFDAAELIVYNRALNDAEMRIVRNALAVRWGLPCADLLWTGASVGFCDDLAGIGSSTATGDGRITGAVETSGNAGGLVLSVASGSLAGANGYLLAAHDGKSAKMAWSESDGYLRVTRTWRTETTLSSVPAVTFAFDLAELGVGPATVRLLYRVNASSAFVDTGINGVLSGSVSSFTFAAGAYKDGEYTLAVDAVANDGTSLPSTSDMTVWFKPEAGLVTDGNGGVVKWENQGSLGSSADVLASSGTVQVVENALATYSALDFCGNSFLKTAGKTDLGRDGFEPPSWFVVFKPGDDSETMKNSGLFGHDSNSPRFGAFFPTTTGSQALSGYWSRVYVGESGTTAAIYARETPAGAWHLLDMTAMFSRGKNCYDEVIGTDAVEGRGSHSNSKTFTYKVTSEYLEVGHFREDSWGNPFPGQIAEIRIYKRSLNPAERLLVEKELSDKYALSLNIPFLGATHASGATYATGIAAVGYEDAEGECGASSATSGGLALDVPGWACGDAKVLYAHNGGSLAWTTAGGITTLARSWYVQSASTLPALRLNFLLGELENGEAYAVYYRTSDTASWVCLPYPAKVANGAVSVKIPAGLATGYFTLGKIGAGEATQQPCAAVSDGLAGWYRADTGVTEANGAVSVWRNIGLLGATADVTQAAGTGSATLSTSVFAEGGVNFGGSAILRTTGDIKWTASNNNNTWFAVFKVADNAGLPSSSMPVFGTSSSDPRFGAMFPSATTVLRLRTHGYVQNSSEKYCQFNLENDALGKAMIVDSLRSGTVVDSYLNGSRKVGKSDSALGNSNANTFNIGNMAGMGSKFQGDIAEIRVYNRAISDVERNIVANHLAARYGVTMDGNLLYGGAAAGCTLDVVGVGCSTNKSSVSSTVHVPGNITVSDNSAGLVIAVVGSLADGDYVLAGHGEKANKWVSAGDCVKRMKRAWHITKTNAASLDLKLTFRLVDAGIEPIEDKFRPKNYRLLLSVDGGTTWTDVEVDLTRNGQEFTCTIPAATFAEGQYTIGAAVTAPGLVIFLR